MSRLLWTPSEERINASNMFAFMQTINKEYGTQLKTYPELHQWSVDNIPEFWDKVWQFTQIRSSKPYAQVVDDFQKMPGAKWFPGARLNFAENLLRYQDDGIALIFKGEGQALVSLTYAELYQEVAQVAHSLRAMGVAQGDRVAGFMPNMPQTIIAMLAAVSIGAIWSSSSPDFGIKGVLDRFGQIKPKVLFTADGYFFKGKVIDSLERVTSFLKELPSIEKVVVVPYTRSQPEISKIPKAQYYADFKSSQTDLTIAFEQLPADHPLYIMYSSGTTGKPKCMVQSTGGILVHHLKELMLHTNLNRQDTIFYFTTCGWMMWNWLTSSLAVGATVVLFDGNPFHPDPGVLWELAQVAKINVFGTSAGYIAALQNTGLKPSEKYDLSSLNTLLSTGSPLSEDGFEYIYRDIKSDLQLSSISGGTDLNGCFALGNPMSPVYSGELQGRGLGMKVEAFDDDGQAIVDTEGELVCSAAFPSMPIYFWDDSDGQKYHSAYFDVYPNIWRHGDFIKINQRGGMIIYGRSDATLNPGGVRLGTGDIYRILEQINEIEDSLVIGQTWQNDVRVVLFVKMAGGSNLDDALKDKIKKELRVNASPRHVPALIFAVKDIPYTHNMKKVELAVKNVVHKKPVKNKDSLRNPEALDEYANLEGLY